MNNELPSSNAAARTFAAAPPVRPRRRDAHRLHAVQDAVPPLVSPPHAAPANDASATVHAAHTAEEPLARSAFLLALRREAHRADRSQAPLTVVLCAVDDTDRHALIELIGARKRETDVCGLLGTGLVGVLLADTTADGAAQFTHKLRRGEAAVPFTCTLLSYPHCLIDSLLSAGDDAQPPRTPGAVDWAEGRAYRGKRALDIVGAALALLLFSPAMLLAALAVALTSPGPVIFRQTRVGQRGARFTFYKFRSMRWGVDDGVHRRYVTSFIQGELPPAATPIAPGAAPPPVYKMRTDARITVVGRFIRKTSIDELPQLFNVLQGDMSLVGPRPPLPYETEQYQPWHLRRILDLRPGLTGLWQVHGRSRVSFDDMVRMDLHYIRDCSLRLDLAILLKTLGVVFGSGGAR